SLCQAPADNLMRLLFKRTLPTNFQMTGRREMKTTRKTAPYVVRSIAAAVFVLSAQISLAGSATWLSAPQDSAWENANNWTPGGPPNGPTDTATFAQSSQTGVNISTSQE